MKNDSKMDKQEGSIVGEPTKGFEIKGTFLDEDMKQESLVEVFIKSFENAEKEFEEYNKIVIKLLDSTIKGEALLLANLAIHYRFKSLSATWLTRWYWKRKYHKACKRCKFWEEYNSQFISYNHEKQLKNNSSSTH